MRADPRRNVDTLCAAAKEVFAERGVAPPARLIADPAGVGGGPRYRHFPPRADPVAAGFRSLVDAAARCAAVLTHSFPAAPASRTRPYRGAAPDLPITENQ